MVHRSLRLEEDHTPLLPHEITKEEVRTTLRSPLCTGKVTRRKMGGISGMGSEILLDRTWRKTDILEPI